MRFAPCVLLAFVASLVSATAKADTVTYNPATAFSIASNPNGVWSYGYLDVTGATFTPYALSTAAWHGNSSLEAWSQFAYDSNSYSVVGLNTTNATVVVGGSISIDPDSLFLHPGNNGEKADLRFIAPSIGIVDLSALFEAADTTGGNRDVHVYLDGVAAYSANLSGAKPTTAPAFSLSNISVHAGETIDFAVGYGSDATYSNDATMLAASVTFTTPEPSSVIALGGLGLAGLVIAVRRRRKVNKG